MILDEIYLFLKSAGLASSQATFSTHYLGHSARYYDYLRCSGAEPSLRSLIKLAIRLDEISRGATVHETSAAACDYAKRVMSRALSLCQ